MWLSPSTIGVRVVAFLTPCARPISSQQPQLPAMTSDSQQQKWRDGALSRSNFAIDALSIAKDISTGAVVPDCRCIKQARPYAVLSLYLFGCAVLLQAQIYYRQRRLEDSPFGALRARDLLDQSPRLKSSSSWITQHSGYKGPLGVVLGPCTSLQSHDRPMSTS